MDKKSKVLVSFFILCLLALYGYQYERTVVRHDYAMKANVKCDPSVNSCFKKTCTADDGPDCEEKIYAKLTKNISKDKLCNQYAGDCPDLSCAAGEIGCTIVYCSDDALESGESCVHSADVAAGSSDATSTGDAETSTSTDGVIKK